MLRTVRKITPIVSALVFGVAGIAGVTAVSSVLIGCEDESKPEYYIKRLKDPAVRPAAVKRLIQFFEDAMTRADKNRDDPNVKALLDKIVPPLAESRSSTAAVQDAPIHCGCGAMPREPRRPAATWPHAVATRFACHPDPAVAGEGSLKGATLAAQIQRFFARSETFATLLRETIGAGPE